MMRTDQKLNTEIKKKINAFDLNKKVGCSIYKEQKTIKYLNRFGNTIHKETEVWEDQGRDGRRSIP
jgi:hypothetical protein